MTAVSIRGGMHTASVYAASQGAARQGSRGKIDRERGGWYAALTRENRPLELDFTRGKGDFYHPLGAILLALELAEPPASAAGAPAGRA